MISSLLTLFTTILPAGLYRNQYLAMGDECQDIYCRSTSTANGAVTTSGFEEGRVGRKLPARPQVVKPEFSATTPPEGALYATKNRVEQNSLSQQNLWKSMSMEQAYIWDAWPVLADGSQYDGKRLLSLVRSNQSPFRSDWDVNHLIEEVESELGVQIADIPLVTKGSNNYGFHIKTVNGHDLIARLARGDVNMPHWNGWPLENQVSEVKFEADVYQMLRSFPDIRTSKLLYSRGPVQHPTVKKPTHIKGRKLLVFERLEGSCNEWSRLSLTGKHLLLDQLATIRAALFNFPVPTEFAALWLHERTFDFKAESLSMSPVPTRDFWMHVMTSKIQATIKDLGDRIAWESDNETVGPRALQAKASLLRAIPYILPPYEESLYRFVLEHGDFGIHNVSITVANANEPCITSLYDWETGSIVPAILADPLVAVFPVDLVVNQVGTATVTRIPTKATSTEVMLYTSWAEYYIKKLYQEVPDLQYAIRAGRDVRHLWFALRDWRGSEPEQFFGELGEWAENRLREMGIS